MRRGQYNINPALNQWEIDNYKRLMQRKLAGARAAIRRASGAGGSGPGGAKQQWAPGVGWHSPASAGQLGDGMDEEEAPAEGGHARDARAAGDVLLNLEHLWQLQHMQRTLPPPCSSGRAFQLQTRREATAAVSCRPKALSSPSYNT